MKRLRVLLAAALVIAAVAAGWFLRRPPLERRLLERLPARQAIHAYIDFSAAHRAAALDGWFSASSAWGELGPAAAFVRGLAVGVGSDEITAVVGGVFTQDALKAYLARAGVSCPGSLRDAACAVRALESGGYLSIRLLDAGVLGVVNGPSREGANRLVALGEGDAGALAEPARDALERGAVAWAAIDPKRLDAAMRKPPAGFVNLSLAARALSQAQRAFLTLIPDDDAAIVRLEARAADAAEARELAKVLEGVNRFSAALLERS